MQDLKTIYHSLWSKIVAFEANEAKEIVFLLLQDLWGITKSDLITSKEIPKNQLVDFDEYILRINQSEPIQYILGKAWFRGNTYKVSHDVLIPRPETEELVEKAVEISPKSVLDLGTGSGCIPISIALELKKSEVYAIDISEDALLIAKENADMLKANVKFEKADILNFTNPFQITKFDLIISNPPYVKENEKPEIKTNVINFEPHLALFVSDNDPLVFYKKIAEMGLEFLADDGQILVEINSFLGNETCEVFKNTGYSKVELLQDFFGKDRMIRIKK